MKPILTLILVFCFCSCIYADEIEITKSPNGKYAFEYVLNGKENKLIKGFQSYDYEDYDLNIYETKTNKKIKSWESAPWVDCVKWSPDSKWLLLQTHTRYSSDISFINIKNKDVFNVDFWGYILSNKNKYDFKPTGNNPYPYVDFTSWDYAKNIIEAKYTFNDENGERKGKLWYDFKKRYILELVDDGIVSE